MKRILLVANFSLILMGCNSKADEAIKSDLKTQALKACEETAIKPSMSAKKKTLVKEYCRCSTDKMIAEFSHAELMQMNHPSDELQEKLAELVGPCLDDLQTKTEKLNEE